MKDYRFPNIRRSDDPATVWLHGALLRRLEKPEDLILATVLFRAFGGAVETGEALVPMFTGPGFDEGVFLDAIGPIKAKFNGHLARQLRMANVEAVCYAERAIRREFGYWHVLRGASLREASRALKKVHKIGPEMAYEIVCDLYRTKVLQDAQDGLSWAHPSLAAVQAAGWLTDNDWAYSRRQDCKDAIDLMKELLEESRTEFPDWELSEVQRALSLFRVWAREAQPPRRYRWK